MEEPNLSFIKEIAGEDESFQNSILDIMRKEYPKEVEDFTLNFSNKNYKEASKDVHKIKHKISLLGLKEGLKLATNFEKQLRKGNTELHDDFIKILNKIHVYLY
ncbi:histidine kinase [Polaribacter porphyrae]|uniref:HPt domain-containing protein n=1 Tax=Polaribacter porphyrae TaxID=1137780 RepID=A0A2S7WR61_9FLAO|nr:histidine kinase [Polaribacter porphyrae]PQJ80074.1 hypothetical protein BTO18_13215 [Polaribacter porphyrae]